ncbi:prenylated rab acceptor 1 [Ophiostoma piceae UAMH 11346]|uniref:Prenylated rab acceptor 1 n=1 Tax=Ophiostoma piceae (strain UAMH 11346) TaxID=1262450 RepID=S3CY61_OPHP1|nr:prenylated rab acceptor 1 [Ophiostoma piceae UAMH 11346]
MASRIQIPIEMITSRFQLGDRFNSVRSTSLATRFSNLRPLSEFFDVKRLSKPQNFGDMQSRVNYNLGHFSSNYAVVFVMLCIYTLLTNWWLLFDIIFVASGMFVIGKLDGRDLEVGTFRATTSQLYTGLYVVAIPVGLISSPFATIAWLVGASLVVIIGHASLMDKPIDEAFSGELSGSGRVEELDGSVSGSGSGGDADYHLRYGSSRASGWDQSGRAGAVALRPRGGYIRGPADYEDEDDEDDSASEVTSDDDSEDGISEPGEAELAVLESAMARIRRAQVKQKAQVNLSKAELAALSRHKERQRQGQERVLKRNQRRDRVAVPIEHLGGIAHGIAKLPTPVASGDDSSPQRIPGSFHDDRPGYNPGGYYSPPSAPLRALPSSSSQPALGQQDRYRDDSPFTYSYVHGQPTTRHVSDSATAPQQVNPFKYMTTESRAPQAQYGSGAVPAAQQGAAAPADYGSYSRGASAAVPAAARGRRAIHNAETSEDEDSSGEDDDEEPQRPPVHNTRSRAKQPAGSSHSRRRSRVPGAESESEPRPGSKGVSDRSQSTKTKKSSHSSSTATSKHKSSTGASGSGAPNLHSSSRRRKAK